MFAMKHQHCKNIYYYNKYEFGSAFHCLYNSSMNTTLLPLKKDSLALMLDVIVLINIVDIDGENYEYLKWCNYTRTELTLHPSLPKALIASKQIMNKICIIIFYKYIIILFDRFIPQNTLFSI